MAIEKINFSYPKGTLQSVFDNEALTALELAAKTSKKVDECVEIVNGVEQTAIEATAIIEYMYTIQNQFVTDNSDTRAQLINDNQLFIEGLTASKLQFETDINNEKTTFINSANQTLLDMETSVPVKVETVIGDMVASGEMETLVGANIMETVNIKLAKNELNVLDFGAKGDGITDDTQAFRNALTQAGNKMMNVVVPPSDKGYLIAGTGIQIPNGVSLKGIGNGRYNGYWWDIKSGTTLLLTGGQGNANASPVFILNSGSVISGLLFYHINQIYANPPIEYPYVIGIANMLGNDITIEDIFFFNAYQGIDLSPSHVRSVIRNIMGDCYKVGLKIDNTYDIDRLENIHFMPSSVDHYGVTVAQADAINKYRLENGDAIIINRADNVMGDKLFAYGYKRGLVLSESGNGGAYGQISDLSLDCCVTGIDALYCGWQGLRIMSYNYALDDTLLTKHSIANTARALNCSLANGLLQIESMCTWGLPFRIIDIGSMQAGTTLLINGFLAQGVASPYIINNYGNGKVIIKDMRSDLDKILVYNGVGASPIIFENLQAFKETQDGASINHIFRKYNVDELVDVASVPHLVVPQGARNIRITGNTTIQNINPLPRGAILRIIFADTVTVANSYAFKLYQQFNATPNDTLTLISDGTNMIELCRSINI